MNFLGNIEHHGIGLSPWSGLEKYRPGLGINSALAEIEKNKGTFYDDAVADACLKLFREKNYTLTV
jgi:hypothetical protein